MKTLIVFIFVIIFINLISNIYAQKVTVKPIAEKLDNAQKLFEIVKKHNISFNKELEYRKEISDIINYADKEIKSLNPSKIISFYYVNTKLLLLKSNFDYESDSLNYLCDSIIKKLEDAKKFVNLKGDTLEANEYNLKTYLGSVYKNTTDEVEIKAIVSFKDSVLAINKRHIARIDYLKSKCSKSSNTTVITKVNNKTTNEIFIDLNTLESQKQDFINEKINGISKICNSIWTNRISNYDQGLKIVLYLHDCKEVKTEITNYNLGAIISEPAIEAFDLLKKLITAINDTDYINTESAFIKMIGLADATSLHGDTIQIKYSNNIIKFNEIIDFHCPILSNDALLSKYEIFQDTVLNKDIGSIIKYNWELAIIRVYQVYEKLNTLELFKNKISAFAMVGNEVKDPYNRGVYIEINFPKAFSNIIDSIILKSNKPDLLKYVIGIDSLKMNRIELADSIGIDSLLNVMERLMNNTGDINDLKMKYIFNEGIVLPYVDFDKDDNTLLPDGEKTLLRVRDFMNKHKILNLYMSGHTDEDTSTTTIQVIDLMKLSNERANNCKLFLIKNGIDKQRIVAEGKGETELITKFIPGQGAVRNRRVEIKFSGY